MEQTALLMIDIESWRFCLYEAPNNDLYCDFIYSPVSYADFSLLLKLTPQETEKVKADRNNLLAMADHVRDNYKNYFDRAVKGKDFLLLDKNNLLEIYAHSTGNQIEEFNVFFSKHKIKGAENFKAEFDCVQQTLLDKIIAAAPNKTLSASEIETFCTDYCTENYPWTRNHGIQALNRWLSGTLQRM